MPVLSAEAVSFVGTGRCFVGSGGGFVGFVGSGGGFFRTDGGFFRTGCGLVHICGIIGYIHRFSPRRGHWPNPSTARRRHQPCFLQPGGDGREPGNGDAASKGHPFPSRRSRHAEANPPQRGADRTRTYRNAVRLRQRYPAQRLRRDRRERAVVDGHVRQPVVTGHAGIT
jgi:hypothetical protein